MAVRLAAQAVRAVHLQQAYRQEVRQATLAVPAHQDKAVMAQVAVALLAALVLVVHQVVVQIRMEQRGLASILVAVVAVARVAKRATEVNLAQVVALVVAAALTLAVSVGQVR